MQTTQKKHISRLIPVLLINILVLTLNIILVRYIFSEPSLPALPSGSADTGAAYIYYVTPNGTESFGPVNAGETVTLNAGPSIPGYTFLYWKNVDGFAERSTEITVSGDTWYSAVYTVALTADDHVPYLFLDENGFIHPYDTVTRAEFSEIIYRLMSVKLQSDCAFPDVDASSSCYSAVCALKEAGAITAGRFHPDEELTLRDALSILSAFYPDKTVKCEFLSPYVSDPDYSLFSKAVAYGWIDSGAEIRLEPDEALTRGELANLMNRVLGRSFSNFSEYSFEGNIPDVSLEYEFCSDLYEASLEHEYEIQEEKEIWISSEALRHIDPGFFLIGTKLYYMTDEGCILVNGTVNGFTFDMTGRYTTGDTELDEAIDSVLTEFYEDGMSTDDLMRAAYNHIVYDYRFLSGKRFNGGDIVPTKELAKDFLVNGSGNCYYYASAFCEIARALGYDADVYLGNIGGGYNVVEHGWTGINIDGVIYLSDPEFELYKRSSFAYYMLTPEEAARVGYHYYRNEE